MEFRVSRFGSWTFTRLLLVLVGLVACTGPTAAVWGFQAACPVVIRSEAFLGAPFGVGMISFRIPKQGFDIADPNMIIRTGAVRLTEKQGRIFYPAAGQPAAARFFRGVFGDAEQPTDEMITIWFLFTGDQPLNLVVWGCEGGALQIVPEAPRQQKLQRLYKQWWRQFQLTNKQQSDIGDFPDLVGTYLDQMLANRLGQEPPKVQKPGSDPMQQTIELLTDIDPLRSDMIRQWFSGTAGYEPQDRPMPPSLPWPPQVVLDPLDEIPVEPIAMHVPDDCFYLRFGTWDNQLWLQRLVEEHGGDLGRMIRLRGFRSRVQSKFLNQLALESSQIDQWFGGNLIADVAVIGRDTYFETGASVGVLLYSKDPGGLNGRIMQRRKRFADDPSHKCELVQLELGGKSVSFLSSKDNRYRSFYVTSGNAHLFTTSRSIAESFLKCATEPRSLGHSAEFRYGRRLLPLDRDDTVFVYFPSKFFQKLLEPQYQIELYRRGQSITEMQLIQLARLAATNEGYPDAPLEFLIGNGFLPSAFADRPGGSQIEVTEDGWVDRERGRRGFFTPIADKTLDRVSASEFDWFAKRAQFFQEQVQQLDPMFLGLKRYQRDDNVERVVFDARVAPFGQEKYGWITRMFGPPLEFEVTGDEDDLVRLQLSMAGGMWQRNVPQHQLFAAIQGDVNPTIDLRPATFFDAWKTLKQVPGYLGGWPSPGTLDWIPRLGGMPDQEGYTYSRLLDLWRLKFDDFSVLAFDRERLESLKTKLKVTPSERPAQVRLKVGDLSRSDLDGWANVLNYRRAWEASIANTQLLNVIVDQFGISPENARGIAESLLDVQLVCSLGGEYQLLDLPGRAIWVSTGWPDFAAPQVPQDYRAPVLSWFRGLELEISQRGSQFAVHGMLDIERSKSTGGVLPSFDLFKGFQNLLPGSGDKGKQDKK